MIVPIKMNIISQNNIYININGERLAINQLQGVDLSIIDISSSNRKSVYDLQLHNRSSKAIKVDFVEVRFDRDSLCQGDTNAYRFYKEGLTVVGASGSRRENDCDFELDPDFLKFTVSDADTYNWKQKNVFCGEQLGIVNNKQTGENILFGFVTANNYFCRVILDMNTDILLTAIIDTDGIVINPGSTIVLEKLMIASGNDAEKLLECYATETALQMNAIVPSTAPSGWCSYYYYYGQETESDIIENAQFLAANRSKIPVEYIQIDDGWQKARGDWLESNLEKFPHGMKWLATKIKELGFKSGIWTAPFLVAKNTPVYREHKEWLLRNKDGDLLDMGGNYFLDTSHPEVLKWITKYFKVLRSWGYTYFKLDFIMVETCYGAQYHDRSITRVQAYRKGLSAIREAVGSESFMLGGTSLVAPNVGLVDGCRISTDVTPFWNKDIYTPESPTIFNVCRNIINRGYMHKHFWINDPDCLIVRKQHDRAKYKDIPSLTLDETYMLSSAMILSGGSIFLGDRMQILPPERLDIIHKVFELMNGIAAYPVDRMENSIPCIWFRQGDETENNPHLLGIFNWNNQQKSISIPTVTIDLNENSKYICIDIWNKNKPIDILSNNTISLKPHTCRLISIYK
jgi:alpha-galactosidase